MRVYCHSNIDQYKLAEMVFGIVDNLDVGMVVCKYENLNFEL